MKRHSTMKKILCFIFIFAVVTSVWADEAKRNRIIDGIKLKELGNTSTLNTVTSIYKDSIQVNPYDSICLRQSIRAWDGLMDFVDNFAYFIVLFPSGTKEFTPDKLSTDKLEDYETYAKAMRKGLAEYRALIDSVQNFVPYRSRRVAEDYTDMNGNGDVTRYRGVYYFDDDDNLQRYFWFDETRIGSTYGLINRAVNHDFAFIEQTLSRLGYSINDNLTAFLMSKEEVEFDATELQALRNSRKTQVKRQQIAAQNNQNSGAQHSTRPHTSTTSTAQNNASYYGNGQKYVVTKSICGATYSKEAMKKYTNFALRDDTQGINYMVLTGELVVLKQGQAVTMVDLGYVLSRVRLANGKVVYTDTENLRKQ